MQTFDVVIVGAGAAGLFAAGRIGQAGSRVLLVDHAAKLAEKIRISGGGRCNFTNIGATHEHFLSANPHYCRSALAGYTPQDFLGLVQRYRIPWHEKHRGQLFCDDSSEEIIRMLVAECDVGDVTRWQPCAVREVRRVEGGGPRFELDTERGPVRCMSVVVATGGLPVPKIGATDWGLRLARQFGHAVVEPRPALVPLTFDAQAWAPYAGLSGLSLEVSITTQAAQAAAGKGRRRAAPAQFLEDLLFTHRGLSGPAILQISSYWREGQALRIDLAPGADLGRTLLDAKRDSRRQFGNELTEHLPARLAQAWIDTHQLPGGKPLPDWRDADLQAVAAALQGWEITPDGTEGWKKAEVMAGGVDTRELDSRTMESRRVPGLHFIGEVVDVTGWLGGYNFQWAWASAAACARGLAGLSP
ncbi:MAG: aminoacetone oxidase family FAD-binding enzyme [Aquabacterium sp.]|nr:MAG: aminoacetone oxidase family FAD-binding enzyme [Aquabacterium sp.]